MSRTPWRQQAHDLAARLAHHAYCEAHPEPDPDPACPHCTDRSTYLAFVGAGGQDFRDHMLVGSTISLDELRRRLAEPAPAQTTADSRGEGT